MSPPPPVSYPNRAADMRQRLLGARVKPPKPFTSTAGKLYFLKVPSLEQRAIIMDGAGVVPGKPPTTAQASRLVAHSAIHLVVDEEGKPALDATALDSILSAPADSEVVEVGTAAAQLLHGGESKTLAKQLEEARAEVARLEKAVEESEGNASGEEAGAPSPTSSPAS